ncbi:flagellar export protein FliJ [Hydrogenovibrio sp. SC-1]|uniref:flagellar export protein FliJ n=1 Tax=Hydrogenovibrio sp. SC-1 TaxID=2065820 RepID=UPI000C7BF448|nr:flagellar export protein FliJ [Hydrogenovibrio sp. SC-1]PLA73903.1 flagellar export protein FliJ [Hydrogenovibrio sp. SC-1]
MKAKIERFEMLVDLAQNDLDQARENVLILRQQCDSHQMQLDSLKEYQSGYLASVYQNKQVNSAQIVATQAFIEKVNTAISSQQEQVNQAQQALKDAEAYWIEQKARHQAMTSLLQKLKKDQTIKLAKQEQKTLDELASQKFYHDQKKH